MSAAVFGDVASQNVVGYAAENLIVGSSAKGAAFLAVGDDAMDLTKIVVTGGDNETAENVFIQSLDENGAMVPDSKYFWYNYDDGIDVYNGWFDGAGDPVEEGAVSYGPGEAVWTTADDSFEFTMEFPAVVIGK